MECRKCHKERQQGKNYLFYYGTKKESFSYGFGYRTKQIRYDIQGQRTEWICNPCVEWRNLLSIGSIIVFTVVLIGVGYLNAKVPMSYSMVFSTLLILFGFSLIVLPPYGRTGWGERLAISINRKALKREGHNTFLTTSQYQRITRKTAL